MSPTKKTSVFILNPKDLNRSYVRAKAGEQSAAIKNLHNFYEKYNPGFTFNYKFLDQDYQALYAAEKRVSVLSQYFAGLTILISCLGQFGLASFTAQRRLKEIGEGVGSDRCCA
jgi:hypothetical protein